jgi:hypothetical protein
MPFFYYLEKKKQLSVQSFAEQQRSDGVVWQPAQEKTWVASILKDHKQTKWCFCESAIDALSCFALNRDFIALSTSGANPNPAWLTTFINKGFEIYCGFDSDEIGDRLAEKMMRRYPSVKRLRPIKHDWNEILQSKYHSC